MRKPHERGSRDLKDFPVYFGTHPTAMNTLVDCHALSQEDWEMIKKHQTLSKDFKQYYQAPEDYTWKYKGNMLEINWDHPYL